MEDSARKGDLAIDRRRFAAGAAISVLAMTPGAAFARTPDRRAIARAVAAQHDASLARIQDWIRNPSIAAEGLKMAEGAAYMAELAKDAGFPDVRIMPTDGAPGVFATWDVGATHTLGVYFMYDVKQFDPAEWSHPPLEAHLVDKPGFGKVIVGRGAVNQKGPEGGFLAALHALRAAGRKPPVNLVLVAEGEEEIGSPHFHQIVRQADVMAALKASRGIFIPTGWQDPKTGGVSVNLGAKGIIELELIASGERWGRGPAKDIHSSNKSMVDSPAWRLVSALQTLVSPDGNTPMIDGWFEDVRPLTTREKDLIAANAANQSAEEWMRGNAVKAFIDDLSWPQALERQASQPTVNIQGLVSGYTGPGGKTILPGKATAKLDLRLVPNQTRASCEAKLRQHLEKRGFSDIEVRVTGGYDPTETAEDSRIVQAQLAVLKRSGVSATVNPRLAGSWPGAVFTAPPVSLPAAQFGLGHGSGAHAPDEYFVIESASPKVQGLDGAVMGFVDFLYEMAR